MAKFYGPIGYAILEESAPGVWEERIVEHSYYGDVIRNNRKLQTSSQLNDNITLSNEISIISDPFANENFQHIRYAIYMGTKWKVSTIDVQAPRLVLTLSEVYNG
jgi:hypothetical protein